MEKFLDALQYEHMSESFEGKDPIDFMCDDSEDSENTDDNEELEEEREEVTEHVKDNSPKNLKEENEHLRNLLDSMCELYWASRVKDKWVETILYDPEVIKEVHKVLKKKWK